eukprot:gnl/MRDRNA2_/MRDRNA2_114216_c0_seq1.p1 gnl/MRDRNA2_/MRDRNA2_114216_c0~~gnl/MRDRNA2_/MRDRNA2_114216_c0_seq1.p1  ORF type:complete len:578 (-),score=97.53 gnl/MRDRNA2_/MRDRNA2_114216_c0_seq1:577-2310(-)
MTSICSLHQLPAIHHDNFSSLLRFSKSQSLNDMSSLHQVSKSQSVNDMSSLHLSPLPEASNSSGSNMRPRLLQQCRHASMMHLNSGDKSGTSSPGHLQQRRSFLQVSHGPLKMNPDSGGLVSAGNEGFSLPQGQLQQLPVPTMMRVNSGVLSPGVSAMKVNSSGHAIGGQGASDLSQGPPQFGRSVSLMNLASQCQSSTPMLMEIQNTPQDKLIPSIGPDDTTPKGPKLYPPPLTHVLQSIAGARKSDLEIIKDIQRAASMKLKALEEEIELERRVQAEDWLPGIEAVDDGGKMCGFDNRIGEWDIGRRLGSGAFAIVFAARNRCTNKQEAAKVISKSRLSREDCLDLCNEHASLSKLPKHTNIAGLTGAVQSMQYVYFFQDFAKGKDLFDFIKMRSQNRRQIPLEAMSRIFSDVTRALACCHSYGICHRDIKPENIIVDQDYTTKVVDFGSSCARTEMQKQNVGTVPFIAPECMLGTAQDGAPCDVWSVGIVLMEMMFGLKALSKALGWDSSFPSTEDCGRQLLSHFADSSQGVTFIRAALGVQVSCQRGEELLSSMLQIDPNKRPTMQSLQTFTF